MKARNSPHRELVITAALEQELPVAWLRRVGVEVRRLRALEAGDWGRRKGPHAGVLVVITGVGPEASARAATLVRDMLSPLFVVNIGTAGALRNGLPVGTWVTPTVATDGRGAHQAIDSRLPFEWPATLPRQVAGRLVTVAEPSLIRPHAEAARLGDYVDMEACAQAKVFAGTSSNFHVVKLVSDSPGPDAHRQFQRQLPRVREDLRRILGFLEGPGDPQIAVVVPVHNRRERIVPALRTVLLQSLPPAEVIVVDDGSNDETPAAVRRLGSAVHLVCLPENRGVSAARNAGIRCAQSPWVALLDSDDLWELDKLERQWMYLEEHAYYDVLQCEEIWIRRGRRVNPCKHHHKPCGWIWTPSLRRCLVSPSAVMMRRALLLESGGFDESLPACEDYDLWLRIARHRPVGLCSRAGLIKVGGHEDQLSMRYAAMDRFRVQSLRKALQSESCPEHRAAIVSVLRDKLQILHNGSRKRGHDADAEQYAAWRRALDV